MVKPKTHKILGNRTALIVGLLGFGVIGLILLNSSLAATPTASYQAEQGTLSGSAERVTDATASGGSAVKFTTAVVTPGDLTALELTAVKSKRIMFGHQSVGGNMVSGISALYNSYNVTPITQIDTDLINSAPGGFFADFYVGENTFPLGKIADFDTYVRRYATKLDVAFFKWCYLDIQSGANVQQVFNSYKATMDTLAADFPNIKFVYVTPALDQWNTDSALKREQLANLIRQQYGSTGRVFDLAKIESTRPDGTRVSGGSGANIYYQLADEYTSDGGHLNTTGIRVTDKALFKLLASI